MNVCPVCGSERVDSVMLKFKSDPKKWRAIINCDKCGIVYGDEKAIEARQKLKPCPFCGSRVEFDVDSYHSDNVIYCPECRIVFSPDKVEGDLDILIAAWNRRAGEEKSND